MIAVFLRYALYEKIRLLRRTHALEQLTNSLHQGVIFFDSQGLYREANQKAHVFLPVLKEYESAGKPLTVSELLGYFYDCAVECDESLKGAVYRLAERTGAEDFREVIRWGDGGLCLAEAKKSADGGTVVTLLDAGVAKKQEESFVRLYQSNYKLMQAVEAADSGIIILEPHSADFAILFANEAFCTIVGGGKGEVIGRSIRTFYGQWKGGVCEERIEQALETGRHEDVEIEWSGGKTVRWFHLKLSPVKNEAEQSAFFIGIFTETTTLKLREAEVAKAQKLEALGQISGGVAHDFNNILSIVEGYGRMAHKHINNPDVLQGYIEKILSASKRGAGLTKKMLTFSRHKIVDDTVIDLGETVRQQEPLLLPLLSAAINFKVFADEPGIFIEGTADNIVQILMNLCANARDAMEGAGDLLVKIEKYEKAGLPKVVRGKIEDAPGYACLSVADTGAGMDKETREKIFDPFFTTKEQGKGTGLGMSVVHGLVQQMRGTIDVQSSAKAGTKISIYFPLSAREPSKVLGGSIEDVSSINLKGYTVLVAEDEPDLLALVVGLLEELGMEVLCANNGQDALVKQEDYDGEIDLLLTDVVMPGLGGVKLAELVQALRPDIKTIFMSGYPSTGDAAQVSLPEDAFFIAKPIKYEALARLIYTRLSESKDEEVLRHIPAEQAAHWSAELISQE